MLRKWSLVGLVLLAATALAAGGSVILVDDFNDGDSEGWEENDFTDGRGSFDASSGSYVLKTTRPIPIDDPSVGTLDADWEASEGVTKYANGRLRAKVRANTFGTTIGLLMRENHEIEADYGFYGSTSFGTFYIEYFNLTEKPEAPQTIIAMADPEEFPFVAGQTYILEGQVAGNRLTLKAWKEGEAEPSEPILALSDNRLTANDGTGLATIAFFDPVPLAELGVKKVVVSATVDDITFTPGSGE